MPHTSDMTERAVVLVLSHERELSGHTRSVGISDVHSEVELILVRAPRTYFKKELYQRRP